MVQFLVESAGCNVDLMTSNGRTALDIAVANDKFDIVQILMHNNRTVNSHGGELTMARRATKALFVICNMERRQPENMRMVQYFVETCHANLHELDSREYTVLHSASATGRLQLVQYLFETGHAYVESRGETTRRETPVFVACANGHLDILQYLVEQCRANVQVFRSAIGDSVPHCAVRQHDLAIVQYLVETCRVDL